MVAVTRAALARQAQSSGRPNVVISKRSKKKPVSRNKKPVQPGTSTSKGHSTTHPYNEVVGKSDITDALNYDRYGNPTGREYDLGRDGAFKGYNLLIGQFYSDFQFTDAAMQLPVDALNTKGFQVKWVKTEDAFITELATNLYRVVWIISNAGAPNPKLTEALLKFHSLGGAIFLFADNVPYVCQASEFLQAKFGITLEGNYPGGKTWTYKEDGHHQAGHFGQHEIFTGIKNLFEGITICHPVYRTKKGNAGFVTLATASDNHPSIAVYKPPESSFEGRLCLDCGFTKLYINWDSAGTARYIVNASCWLLGIERNFS